MDLDETTCPGAGFAPRQKLRNLPSLDTIGTETTRQYARPMRTRPSQILKDHHAEPLSPLKQADKNSKLQNRQSNMPLFNLFSKPKVEKSRGYAEQGLSPVASRRGLDGDRSNPDFSLSAGNGKGRDELPRAQSALSFRGKASRTTGSPKNGNPTSHGAQPRKNAAWEAPPLFQAYPQSIKHGMLGVSLMTAESVLQKSKSRMATGTHGSGGKSAPRGSLEDTGSTDTRRGAKTTMRHVANGAVGYVELPRKIFVLATSGYLLQYAESGPSNRLPERLLELGEESAAYACDLIPGKHHVLQVSQAVDSSGVMIANSGGIFAKLGMRSAAAKRITSHFLLVMPDAREMESWMAAIRLEIEGLSKNARPKTGVGPASKSAAASASGFDELKKMPSMSHRYQVKRDPTSPRLVEKPSADAFDTLLPPPRIMDDDENSAADTIEGIENDAERLAEEAKSQPRKKTRDHDTQSTTSSAAGSEQQQRLNSLRNSQRMSHATVVTTATSRTNSPTGSPPSDRSNKASSEASRESVPHTKTPYRSLTSYAVTRRRSAVPLPKGKPLPPLDIARAQRQSTVSPVADRSESPILSRNSFLPMASQTSRNLAVAASEPDLRGTADIRAKHDSKMPTPPLPLEESERPQSIVGELPFTSNWTSERTSNKRTSLLHSSSCNAQRPAARTSESRASRRLSSNQSFSMPLKINPSYHARPPSRENNGSFNTVDEGAGKPRVHTLTAQIEPSRQPSAFPGSTQPNADLPSTHISRTQSARLSLFPTASEGPLPPADPASSFQSLRRSPTATATTNHSTAQGNPRPLRRPTSMQVLSDHAPFLGSLRASTSGPPPATTRSFTAPIRNLRPSRSSVNLSTASTQLSPTDPFSFPSLPEEGPDPARPFLDRGVSPMPSRPGSRSGGRRLKTRSSLPALDLGIPVIGLGPPAPPPSAPLPAPPAFARSPSAVPNKAAGLGIRI